MVRDEKIEVIVCSGLNLMKLIELKGGKGACFAGIVATAELLALLGILY